MGKDLNGKELKICDKAIISMMKSLEIKGFIGGNIKNEIRNRYYETDFINVNVSC